MFGAFQRNMASYERDLSVGFPPIARPDARVLVLGSLPGRRSLETGQYYAHPRNGFWPIMRSLAGATGDYEQRCERLKDAGIAVWDVLHAAVRPGSLDSRISLKTAQTNDFESFFSRHMSIECVAFNGRKAEALFLKQVEPLLGLELPKACLLPSTSPAHASLTVGEKASIWRSMLGPSLNAISEETRP